MNIQRFHHAQITVPSDQVTEARRFYCDLLGLQEIPKPASLQARGGFWLQLGDIQIHVGVEDGFDRHQTNVHLAYQVEALDDWGERLLQEGITIKESIPIPGYNRFEFRDPFGNRVEMIEVAD